MTIRRLLMLTGCLATCAAAAQACPDHVGAAAAKLAPRTAFAPALVAWKPRAWRPVAAQPAAAGLRVSLDPETGLPGMPRPEEFESLARASSEDERPVAIHWRANGSGRATLDERWEDHAVVTLDASGRPRWTCVHGKSAADRFLRQPVVPTPRTPAPAPGTVWEEK
jgi:hypothetical protein